MVDDGGGVVEEAVEGVELAVHEGVAGGAADERVGGEAVADDAGDRRGSSGSTAAPIWKSP